MTSDSRQQEDTMLTVRSDQMLFAIPVDKGGVEETLFTTVDIQSDGEEPIKLAGAWRHLDWNEAQAFFDRIDREGVSSAPLHADDF